MNGPRSGETGMRAGNIDRVKRRVLREAVAENLDVMRGMPPRALRPATRWSRLWLRRVPLLLVAAMVAGSSYQMANNGGQAIPPVFSAAIMRSGQAGSPVLQAPETTESAERMTASVFPLAVKRVVLDAG